MNITDASFITSIVDSSGLAQNTSEVVFMGRSNVGKSSLLNAITNKRNLAKKSQTPGKTQTINYFDINYKNDNKVNFKCLFVDLPGIGYAKVSKSIKNEWAIYLNKFISNRSSIKIYIYLIDSRHIDLDIDNNVLQNLQNTINPDQIIIKVYTKSDKINQSQKAKILSKDKKAMLVSSTKLKGINELNKEISNFLFNDNCTKSL